MKDRCRLGQILRPEVHGPGMHEVARVIDGHDDHDQAAQ
jgi:hypothetical protein